MIDSLNKQNPEISIVIPVHNEEENVEILYEEIESMAFSIKKTFEVIFVDDGSVDSTVEHLTNIVSKGNMDRDSNVFVRVIEFSRNFGQTSAMQAGFDHAQGEIVISMDGDLQNNPCDIPKFIDKIEEGYDVVCGWRNKRQDKILTRIIPSKVANWIIRRLTGVQIHDNGCSLKAYRRAVVKSLKLYSDMHRFIPAMATIVGARITEIEVNHRKRRFGKAKYGLSRTWKVASDMITIELLIHFGSRPLVWFAGLGLIFLFIGSILGIISVFDFMKGERSIVFSTSSILLLFLFSSLLSWGLLADFFIKKRKQ